MRPALFLSVLLASPLCLAGPREKATDYPAHAESARIAVGAEYLVHSFSNGRQTFFLPGHLVVDTAVYPHGSLVIRQSHFKLVINRQITLAPQAPNMVAYSLKNLGSLDTGQRGGGSQFPGDSRGTAPSQPPQAPDPMHPERDPEEPADVALTRTALEDGEFQTPQSGFLYFPFDGKTKKIKSLDLVYNDDAETLTVKLF